MPTASTATVTADGAPHPGCPKFMSHGPCGGVATDGTCELGDRRCVFVDGELVTWEGPAAGTSRRSDPLLDQATQRPIVVVDLPERSLDPDSVRRAAAGLAGVADAALFGDSGWARVQLPPSFRAALVAQEGLRPWAGLNCRDRNRVALEGELAALAEIGALVHCVTGDHTELGDRPDAKPVFDLDSLELAALANRLGLTVSVGENPVSPPYDQRPLRAAEKAKAGAHACFVNHAGSADRVRWFVEATTAAIRARGAPGLAFLACVPLVASREGLALIKSFTALALPDGFVAAIEDSSDPFRAGVDQAVAHAREVLAVPGIGGINLSAASPVGSEDVALRASVAVIEELRR
jgi:5,10-methylenetetrahydrofolate reductase